MDLYILDEQFRALHVVDDIRSFVWTERYDAYGDFELILDFGHKLTNQFRIDRYMMMTESSYFMFIEAVETKRSAEDTYLKISGRSLESLLERRVVLGDANNPPNANELLFFHLDWGFVNEFRTDTDSARRRISNFSFIRSVPSGSPTRSGYQYEFKGKTIYEVVQTICRDHRNGFRINQVDNQLTFRLYRGSDRTIENATRNPVIFSEDFDNLENWNFLETQQLHKNLAYMDIFPNKFLGERYKTHISGTIANPVEPTGIKRREMFVDASQIDDLYTTQYDREFQSQVLGQQELRKVGKRSTTIYDAQINPDMNPTYKKDYFLGDEVTFENDFTSDRLDTVYRVNEYTYSYSQEGSTAYPTFLKIGDYS